jgi:hypothetical protein
MATANLASYRVEALSTSLLVSVSMMENRGFRWENFERAESLLFDLSWILNFGMGIRVG